MNQLPFIVAVTTILRNSNRLKDFSGEFLDDSVTRKLYSTDASVYQEIPTAVAFPKNDNDVRLLIELAIESGVGLIPRTAGTSLAGQVVGSGIVVDVSRYMTEIIEINAVEKWVRVQPGVIRNELNMALRSSQLFFGPETSTSNRAMIGGMLGNNSCGSNSIVYGTTRDKTISVKGFLSDGSFVTLEPKSVEELDAICARKSNDLESKIYRKLRETLADPENQREIQSKFPKPEVTRRNTGYAIDFLMQTEPFGYHDRPFNLAQLVAGSEGTLMLATEIKLQCDPLPPIHAGVLCAHFESINAALRANIIAMQFTPFASELIDRLVLEGAKRNIAQRENMRFVEGDPAAILIVEIRSNNLPEIHSTLQRLISQLKSQSLGYAFPLFVDLETTPVWELRKAGLGVVANVPGDAKPTTVIEDTAVSYKDLPDYIRELNELLKTKYDSECVHYGHAGSGELHLRPILDLKSEGDRNKFKSMAADVAQLVKKYRGSLSGEHGDGRLRGFFICEMIGDHNYQLLKEIKRLFDPDNIFNPGKIIDVPSMVDHLRSQLHSGEHQPQVKTVFDHSRTNGFLGGAEMCSGSGDCRKTELTGGTMCPSYMATRAEKDSTRGRANVLRHALTDANLLNPLASEEVKAVMDLCLSCKGCKSECPSNVDIAKLKSEFMQGYQDATGTTLRTRLIVNVDRMNRWNSRWPWLYNWLSSTRFTAGLIKRCSGFHAKRTLPALFKQTLRSWFKRHSVHDNAGKHGRVLLFCDEFTNYYDVNVGIAAVELLERLGYSVELPHHLESGRAAISKGQLKKAKEIAICNVQSLSSLVSEDCPLIGLEPSALLTFRDEYIDLASNADRESAKTLASHCLLIDEFVDRESRKGLITAAHFSNETKTIRLHGHCHQKALASMAPSVRMLQLPKNYSVKIIPSGCCGMAGSFGYEKEHYDVSMQIGELVLFPTIRNEPEDSIIAAAGTSCRHQIYDGTRRTGLHPAEILRKALVVN